MGLEHRKRLEHESPVVAVRFSDATLCSRGTYCPEGRGPVLGLTLEVLNVPILEGVCRPIGSERRRGCTWGCRLIMVKSGHGGARAE